MKAGIHLDRHKKISPMVERFKSILEFNGYEVELLDINQQNFWQKVETLDYFIYRFSINDDQKQIASSVIPVIERNYDIKVFPNQNSCWSYDDKVKESFLMNHKDFPFVETKIFFDKNDALNWAASAKYPFVFKLRSGARAQNVILVKNYSQAKFIIKKMFGKGIESEKIDLPGSTQKVDFTIKKYFHNIGVKAKRFMNGEDLDLYWTKHKNYVLFQKFLPNNDFDTRITTIGNRAFRLRRLNRENDFRASGSPIRIFDDEKADIRPIEIALKLSKQFGFQSMAYDFIYDKYNEPKIIEFSYAFPDKPIDNSRGYWDSELNYHSVQNCPEYYILIDLLNNPDLRVPNSVILDKVS